MKTLLSFALCAALLHPALALACDGEGDAGKTQAQGQGTLKVPAPGASAAAAPVLKRHIAALGGQAALKGASTLTFTLVNQENGERVVAYHQRPNLMRKEVHKDGKVMVKAFDGRSGWKQEGEAQAVVLSEKDARMMAQHARFDDPLVDPKGAGAHIDLVGAADVDGAPAHHLRLTYRDGGTEDRFLDQGSGLEVKRVVRHMKDGKQQEKAIYFSDYRKVDGIAINHAVAWESDGKRVKMLVTEASYRRPLSAGLFQRPANARLASR